MSYDPHRFICISCGKVVYGGREVSTAWAHRNMMHYGTDCKREDVITMREALRLIKKARGR